MLLPLSARNMFTGIVRNPTSKMGVTWKGVRLHWLVLVRQVGSAPAVVPTVAPWDLQAVVKSGLAVALSSRRR